MTQPDPLPTLAWLSALPDCTSLVDAFLAGRSPRTRADFEDFRCYTRTSTAADAARWLLANLQVVAHALVRIYRHLYQR
jgi:hypothetical protein